MLASPVYSQNAVDLDVNTGKKILVVGDSLSAAYKLAEEQGWVSLLQRRLREEKTSHTVVNASVSGATTAAGIRLMRESLAQHSPDIVLLELGANDGLQGKPVSYIQANLERLIGMAKDTGAEVMLLGIRLPPNFGPRYTEPFHEQYHQLAKTHDLPLVPFLLDGVAGVSELMMSDGLHPRAEGQPLILDNVWPVLEELL